MSGRDYRVHHGGVDGENVSALNENDHDDALPNHLGGRDHTIRRVNDDDPSDCADDALRLPLHDHDYRVRHEDGGDASDRVDGAPFLPSLRDHGRMARRVDDDDGNESVHDDDLPPHDHGHMVHHGGDDDGNENVQRLLTTKLVEVAVAKTLLE